MINKQNRYLKLTVLLLFVLFVQLLFSCDALKEPTGQAKTGKPDTIDFANRLKQNTFPYQTFSAGVKISLKGSDFKQNMNGRIRWQKDSLIWLSVLTPFGMEGMRLQITPDSLMMVNRLERSYFKDDLKGLRNFLGFSTNFRELQKLLFADFVLDPATLKVRRNENDTIQAKLQTLGNTHFQFTADYLVSQYKRNLRDQGVLYSARYGDYVQKDAMQMPERVRLTYEHFTTTQISFKYASMKGGHKQKYPFSIPESYSFRKF